MAIQSFTDVKGRVMEYTQKSSQVLSEFLLEDLMLAAESRLWGVLRVPEMRSFHSFTYSAGGEALSSFDSGNLIEVIAVLVDTNDSTREPVQPGSESALREWMIVDDTDAPRVFSFLSQDDGSVKLAIGPEPTDRTVYVPYFRKFGSITDSTNAVFTEYPHIWLFALLAEVALFLRDNEMYQAYDSKLTEFVKIANALGRGINNDKYAGGVPGPHAVKHKWRP